MSEKNPRKYEYSNDDVPNVYPNYFPRERLAELADIVLGPKDPSDKSSQAAEDSITWTNKQSMDKYYLEKLQRFDSFYGNLHRITITHIANESPNGRKTNQYVLESFTENPDEQSYRPIKQIIHDGIPTGTPLVNEYVSAEALMILYQKPTPPGEPTIRQIAEHLLKNRIDSSFSKEIMGEYLLSDYAIVKEYNSTLPKITRSLVLRAVQEFETFIAWVEHEEKAKSLKKLNDSKEKLSTLKNITERDDSYKERLAQMKAEHNVVEAKHLAVVDAMESSPVNGRHWSTYVHQSLAKAAVTVLGRLPQKKWNNVIVEEASPKTSHKSDEESIYYNDPNATEPIDISKLNLDDD